MIYETHLLAADGEPSAFIVAGGAVALILPFVLVAVVFCIVGWIGFRLLCSALWTGFILLFGPWIDEKLRRK